MNPNDILPEETAALGDVRLRILNAASHLIASGGSAAVTTRAVATAAGVQAPTIYRFFGDKRGLLNALAEHELASYIARKDDQEPHSDPVEDLRIGWNMHIAFCLDNPELFAVLVNVSGTDGPSAATEWGKQILRRRIHRIAQVGRLTTSEDRALATVQSAGTGMVLTLLQQPNKQKDTGLSAFIRDMTIASITSGKDQYRQEKRRPQTAAAELKSTLDGVNVLSAGERHFLDELLDRIASAA